MTDSFPTSDMALTSILVVADATVSARWYKDVLGAELHRKYGTSAVFSFNGSWLLLVEGGPPTPDKPHIEYVPPTPTRASHSFTIRVADCEAAHAVLTSRGAVFLTPPHDWGAEIRCFFPDPDGHLWEISQLVD